ncbi:MAG: hypothetical protein CMB99_00065 [Flavobacteriaceae bacterium]|jgi:hypothetical protein|nr:hypothetical protein [Flavobacteriaceae bacterium]|tara:strand:- start:21735 stop:22277 length:543 start_codon:yes stop_codon:yes gene_type:complete
MRATRQKFDIQFDVIDKGSGKFCGALEDIDLSEGSTIDWVAPRRILKVDVNLPLKGGMVIQSPQGMKYMVAWFSPSETSMGDPFRAFKLYQATTVASLRRRSSSGTDARTGLPKEGALGDPVEIYASYEPLQEAFDRELRIPNEKGRLITNEPLFRNDVINGETVIEVHEFQGLWGAVLA